MKPVFLIGLPGCGKTTLAKQWAAESGIPFLDLDTVIEAGEAQSVRELFQQEGEPHFREVERKYLLETISAHPVFIMATGGGTPCFHQNMEAMNRAGITVFLDVPVMEIVRRLEAAGTASRPLLANTSREVLKDRIEFLRTHRLPFYRKAAVTLAGDHIGLAGLKAVLR